MVASLVPSVAAICSLSGCRAVRIIRVLNGVERLLLTLHLHADLEVQPAGSSTAHRIHPRG